MSARTRVALFAAASGAIAACGLALALSRDDADVPADEARIRPAAGTRPPLADALATRTAVRLARAEDEASGAPARDTRARRVFGAFFAAFTRYEIGAVSMRVRRRLYATATRSFAGELLAAPPRPLDGRAPAVARLVGRPELVPRDAPDRATALATVRRGGRLEAVSFALVRRSGRWVVSGAGSGGG